MSIDLPDYFTLTELIQQLSAEVGTDFHVSFDTGVLATGAQATNNIVVPANREYYVTQAWCVTIAQIALVQPGHYAIWNLTDAINWGDGQFPLNAGVFLPFTKPFRATAGQTITQYVTNLGPADGRFVAGYNGYYIVV